METTTTVTTDLKTPLSPEARTRLVSEASQEAKEKALSNDEAAREVAYQKEVERIEAAEKARREKIATAERARKGNEAQLFWEGWVKKLGCLSKSQIEDVYRRFSKVGIASVAGVTDDTIRFQLLKAAKEYVGDEVVEAAFRRLCDDKSAAEEAKRELIRRWTDFLSELGVFDFVAAKRIVREVNVVFAKAKGTSDEELTKVFLAKAEKYFGDLREEEARQRKTPFKEQLKKLQLALAPAK